MHTLQFLYLFTLPLHLFHTISFFSLTTFRRSSFHFRFFHNTMNSIVCFFSSWHYTFMEYLTKCIVYTLNKRTRREKNFFYKMPSIVICFIYEALCSYTGTAYRVLYFVIGTNFNFHSYLQLFMAMCVHFVSRPRSNVTASQSYSEENVTEVTREFFLYLNWNLTLLRSLQWLC